MVMNVYAKFSYGPLRIKKAFDIFRKLVTRRTTGVAIWDPSRVQKVSNGSKCVCGKRRRLNDVGGRSGMRVRLNIDDCSRVEETTYLSLSSKKLFFLPYLDKSFQKSDRSNVQSLRTSTPHHCYYRI